MNVMDVRLAMSCVRVGPRALAYPLRMARDLRMPAVLVMGG